MTKAQGASQESGLSARLQTSVVQKIVTSGLVKNKVAELLAVLLTAIVRAHLAIIVNVCLSHFIRLPALVDFCFQVLLAVILGLSTGVIHAQVTRLQPQLRKAVKYFIDRYTPENFRRWKIYATLSSCAYIGLGVSLSEIDQRMILVWIVQYAVSFLLLDVIEQRKICKLIRSYQERPVSILRGDFEFIPNYLENMDVASDAIGAALPAGKATGTAPAEAEPEPEPEPGTGTGTETEAGTMASPGTIRDASSTRKIEKVVIVINEYLT
ncbi:MAG: hypothetical protein ACYCOU_10295 [Sulfobacillus sp.]